MARHAPVTLEALLAAAAASAPPAPAGSSDDSGGGTRAMMGTEAFTGFGSTVSMSVLSEAAGGASMAVDAGDTDGIEVDGPT